MKKRTSVFNSPAAGFMLASLSNILVIGAFAIINRYSTINSRLYFIAVLSSILMILIVNIFFLIGYVKKRKLFRVFFVIMSFSLSLVLALGTWYIYRGNTSIDKIINDMAVEELEYSLITLDDTMTLQFLSDEKIAIIKDTNTDLDEEVKKKLSEYSKELEYIEYDTYRNLLMAAQEDEYSLMVVPSDFRKILDNPEDEIIFENSAKLLQFNRQQEEEVSNVNVLEDPFTVLMLGNNEGLSDSIIVASFNPKTLKATMTSLARDSYVPIACYPYGLRDKLNHSRAYSRQCTVDTVEDFLDIEIDFYFETDFYALVKMVDTVGGIEINSPVSFAGTLPIEGKINEFESVLVKEGTHLLNGKEAITFARERHHMPGGDFDRQLNQQYVIQTLAEKIFATRNIETFMSLLDVAKDNMIMNIPVRSLSSLVGYAMDQITLSPLDGLEAFRIVQTQVTGTTPTVEGLSVVMPYLEDIERASRLINDNVSTDFKKNDVKHFSFSYTEPYKADLSDITIEGSSGGTLGGNTLFTVPNFSGWTLEEIRNWGNIRGIQMIIEEVIGKEANTLITQNPAGGTLSNKPSEIFIKYRIEEPEPEPEVEKIEITIPDFKGEEESAVQAWAIEMKNDLGEDLITWQFNEESISENGIGLIAKQSKIGIQRFENSLHITFTINKYLEPEPDEGTEEEEHPANPEDNNSEKPNDSVDS